MHPKHPIQKFLKEKGCGQQIVDRGFIGLVESWEQTVREVESGYRHGLDDYLNDMDVRQLIAGASDRFASEIPDFMHERVAQADQRMRSATAPAGVCLWGESLAQEEGWTAEKNWWYFSRPLQAEPELLADIDEVILQNDQ